MKTRIVALFVLASLVTYGSATAQEGAGAACQTALDALANAIDETRVGEDGPSIDPAPVADALGDAARACPTYATIGGPLGMTEATATTTAAGTVDSTGLFTTCGLGYKISSGPALIPFTVAFKAGGNPVEWSFIDTGNVEVFVNPPGAGQATVVERAWGTVVKFESGSNGKGWFSLGGLSVEATSADAKAFCKTLNGIPCGATGFARYDSEFTATASATFSEC